ncbi:MAG: hypothetical protein ABR575_09720 [Actinomycetota bacterium]
MEPVIARRAGPFVVAGAASAIVCLAVLRIPALLLGKLERSRPLTEAQAGWAYRLLVLAAVGQAVYGAFVVLRPETIARARAEQPRMRALTRVEVVRSVARTAAAMTGLTIVYGLAALGLTAQRGGFWLFPLVALAQGAWYYRQVGEVARWMSFQPDTDSPVPTAPTPWAGAGPDYCPPIARGLTAPRR